MRPYLDSQTSYLEDLDRRDNIVSATMQHRFLDGDVDRVDLILESVTSTKPTKHGLILGLGHDLGSSSSYHHHHLPPFDFRPNPRVLGTAGVAAITFFYGCGGPLGSEDIVQMGGPLVAMLALSLYPVVFTIPYGAVVAELCSAFPEDGGFTIWVTNAFGSFWGLQIGYWSWVAGIFGGAIYPAYLLELVTRDPEIQVGSPLVTYLVKASIGLALALPTFLSTKTFGKGAVCLLLLVYVPLVLYVFWCFAQSKDTSQLAIVRYVNSTQGKWDPADEAEQLSLGIENSYYDVLNAVFWNYDGIQMASVFGGQVANPARVYGRAICITLSLTIAAYVVPIPATLLAEALDWTQFTRGSYVDGASRIGGDFLKTVMLVSTISTNMGLYMSSLFCKSFEMAGMADSNLLPQVFSERNALFGSPHFAILLTMILTAALAGVDTETLVPVTNVFAALVTLTIFLSAIQLRHTLPFMPRPTKIPGGITALVVLAVIPCCVCGYLIIKNILLGWKEAAMITGFFVPGLCLGALQAWNYRQSFEQ